MLPPVLRSVNAIRECPTTLHHFGTVKMRTRRRRRHERDLELFLLGSAPAGELAMNIYDPSFFVIALITSLVFSSPTTAPGQFGA